MHIFGGECYQNGVTGNMLAIIPARGGSKGVPGKNIKELCGKPLIAYTIEAALDAQEIDRCIAVDENGNIVDGDAIMYVCGTYMKECGQLNNNTVVTTVMSNIGLYRAFEEKGIATACRTVKPRCRRNSKNDPEFKQQLS